jgi:hypothetical protein
MELIKQMIIVLIKYAAEQNQKLSQHINKIIKNSLINTMLYMVEHYSSSSIVS